MSTSFYSVLIFLCLLTGYAYLKLINWLVNTDKSPEYLVH